MEPERFSPAFEAEVAAINTEIEARRSALEHAAGIEEPAGGEQLAKAVISDAMRSAGDADPASPSLAARASYLDSADPETAAAVNALIEEIQENGIAAAVADARTKSPYVLDAFHDALVDKLYASLKQHGII